MSRRGGSRATVALILLSIAVACGGGGGEPVAPPTPVEPLPVLTTLRVVLPSDSLVAGELLPASIIALDHKARPMVIASIAWTSSNPAVATVGPDGAIRGLTAGTTTIRAQVGQIAGEHLLIVAPPPPGPLPVHTLDVAPVLLELNVGDTRSLTATPRDFLGNALGDRVIEWTSSNDSVAIVNPNGEVTARRAGEATIIAVSESRRGGAVVSVRSALDTSITITIASPKEGDQIGDTVTVLATVRASATIDSVLTTVGGATFPMYEVALGALGGGRGWKSVPNVSTLPFGPLAIVVSAYTSNGGRSVVVVRAIRSPTPNGGSGNGAGGSK